MQFSLEIQRKFLNRFKLLSRCGVVGTAFRFQHNVFVCVPKQIPEHVYDLTRRTTSDKNGDCSIKSGTVGRSACLVYGLLSYSSLLVTQSKEKNKERLSKDAILFDAAARMSNGSEELPA